MHQVMSTYLHDDDVVAGPIPLLPEPRAKRPKLVGSDDVVSEVVDEFAISPRFSPAAFVAGGRCALRHRAVLRVAQP
jgi:hypothetical protein